ncbi:MAG: SPFH domain-containing protein [Victivallales bacterium]|nr:SPFH domain-containing protein [Victivallales bacterium]
MAIIDVVKWDAAPGVFAWKYPSSELSTWTQLIVHESQEAVLFKEGQAVGPFTAGRHILSAENYPILSSLLKIPFGRSPFTAEVWFVSKAIKLDVKWGTSMPISVEDPKYHIILPVRAFGQYGISVENPTKFLVKMVGTLPAFTQKTLSEYFKGIIVSTVGDTIGKYIIEKDISVLMMSAKMHEIGDYLEKQIAPVIDEYGLKLTHFTVASISTDENDPAVITLKKAMATRAEMDIVGYNYQQKRSFDTMEGAANNPGAGNVMNAGLGMGMGFGMGGTMMGMTQQMAGNLYINAQKCPHCGQMNSNGGKYCSSCGKDMSVSPESESIICPKCGYKNAKGSKFCSNCGATFFLCPNCGAANDEHATKCARCGSAMPVKCQACGTMVNGGMKFCPSCGKPMKTTCPSCGMELTSGMKFCANCGTKIETIES